VKDAEGRALRTLLVDLFSRSIDDPLPDEEFNRIALRVFAWQFARNAPYSAFCTRRGRTPAAVSHWTDVPALPTAAFKEVALVAGDAAAADVVFRTSGTSMGTEKRGLHHVLDVSIYHFSLIPNFAACLLPDGAELRMLSLIPPATEIPDSSLSHMASVVLDRLGAPDSAFHATAARGIDDVTLHDALVAAERDDAPVCLLGTSFAFVHWIDRLAARNVRYRLPRGSRLMDTGGYKGRSREVEESAMRDLYAEHLGITADYCVNEYGMTEMCSQFYDSTLRDAVRGRAGERRKLVAPWVRTRVVDPETLQPIAHGETGLLQHFDLANVHSVMAVQTEDLGYLTGDGFRLLGRAPGAAPRGCSIAMDMLLEAVQKQHR
jgi:hypothetical protein